MPEAATQDARPADAVAPYPRELVRTVELRGGRSVRIRPIRPDDEPRLVDLYERLSRDSAYQRFFTLMRHLPSDWYHFFANVDYVRRLALVAERETIGGVQLIGVGRYEPVDEPATAEVAFVVEDGWQERGLGAILLGAVLDAATARGIERFRADVLADNHRMLRLFTSRTRIEHRITESGVTSLRFRRADAGAPPRSGRAR
ncbi:MAG: GNAT family N-acetyltransferase [Candidatus Rokuibacteriota bacterium]|jgi:RimJ/RimL family protein N-acetyltransferase